MSDSRKITFVRFLGGLAVAQAILLIAVLTTSSAEEAHRPPRPFPEVGDQLPLAQIQPYAAQVKMRGRNHLLVLTVSSNCGWTDSVIPTWKMWLAGSLRPATLALTQDSAHAVQSYLEAHGLALPVVSTVGLPDSAVWRVASGRTPWMFLTDSNGTLLKSVHGKRTASIDSVTESWRTTQAEGTQSAPAE